MRHPHGGHKITADVVAFLRERLASDASVLAPEETAWLQACWSAVLIDRPT